MDSQNYMPQHWDDLSQNRNKWSKVVNELLSSIGTRLIESLALSTDAFVLDIATGTGEPGLTIAEQYPDSRVIGIDLSEKMVEISQQNARQRKVKNFESYCCSALALPFEEAVFDAVLCRNGVMFFSQLEVGLKEMKRVLKVGHKMSVSTWGLLDKNLWISMVLDAAKEVTGRKMYNSYIPGMFYCMQPGFMTDWFEQIGMGEIEESELTGIIEFSSTDEHWDYVTSVSDAVVNALSGLQESELQQIRQLVRRKVSTHMVNGKLYFQWTSRITSGVK